MLLHFEAAGDGVNCERPQRVQELDRLDAKQGIQTLLDVQTRDTAGREGFES